MFLYITQEKNQRDIFTQEITPVEIGQTVAKVKLLIVACITALTPIIYNPNALLYEVDFFYLVNYNSRKYSGDLGNVCWLGDLNGCTAQHVDYTPCTY